MMVDRYKNINLFDVFYQNKMRFKLITQNDIHIIIKECNENIICDLIEYVGAKDEKDNNNKLYLSPKDIEYLIYKKNTYLIKYKLCIYSYGLKYLIDDEFCIIKDIANEQIKLKNLIL